MFRLCAFLSILLSTLALWHFLPQFLRHNLALGALLPTSTLNGYLIMQHSKLFAPLWGGSEQRNGSPPASIISYQTSTTVVQLKLNSYSMHTTSSYYSTYGYYESLSQYLYQLVLIIRREYYARSSYVVYQQGLLINKKQYAHSRISNTCVVRRNMHTTLVVVGPDESPVLRELRLN